MWQTIGEIIVIIYWFGHGPAILLTLYWLAFREWPFPKGYKWSDDLKLLNNFRKEVTKSLYSIPDKGGPYQYSEEDFYDPGQASPDERAKVRHPKNADRAYKGGS